MYRIYSAYRRRGEKFAVRWGCRSGAGTPDLVQGATIVLVAALGRRIWCRVHLLCRLRSWDAGFGAGCTYFTGCGAGTPDLVQGAPIALAAALGRRILVQGAPIALAAALGRRIWCRVHLLRWLRR